MITRKEIIKFSTISDKYEIIRIVGDISEFIGVTFGKSVIYWFWKPVMIDQEFKFWQKQNIQTGTITKDERAGFAAELFIARKIKECKPLEEDVAELAKRIGEGLKDVFENGRKVSERPVKEELQVPIKTFVREGRSMKLEEMSVRREGHRVSDQTFSVCKCDASGDIREILEIFTSRHNAYAYMSRILEQNEHWLISNGSYMSFTWDLKNEVTGSIISVHENIVNFNEDFNEG
jgi:hypothetical protein